MIVGDGEAGRRARVENLSALLDARRACVALEALHVMHSRSEH